MPARCWLLAGLASLAFVEAAPAAAAGRVRLNIPAGPVVAAVAALALQARVSIGYAGALPTRRIAALRGTFTADEALARLLAGSDLVAVRLDAGAFRLQRRQPGVRQPASGGPSVQEVVVQGVKRRETLSSVPFAVRVLIPAREPSLQDRAPTTADAAALAGDVQLTNLGPGRNRIFIRGVADSAFSGPTQSTVSIYLDDARISFDAPDPDLRLVDVERVEVLKGPQGSLYGAGALGGIYRIVPAKPQLGERFALFAVQGGGRSEGALSGGLEGVVNLPVGRHAAARLAAYALDDGGWIDDVRRGLDDVNRTRTVGGRASVRVELGGDWTAEIAATGQSLRARDAQYAVRSVGGRRRASPVAQPSDNDFGNLRLAASGSWRGLQVDSTTSVVGNELDNSYDASAAAAPSAGPVVYRESQSLRMATHETRISDPARQRPWVVGVSLLSERSDFHGHTLRGAGGAPPTYELQRDFAEAAVFAEASQNLTQALEATLGLRLALSQAENETKGAPRVRDRKALLAPTAALSWRPRADLQLYARYASASRPGGLNPSGQPARFDADELQSLELGARYGDPEGRLGLTLEAFGIRWREIQSDLLQSDGLTATANVGDAHNLGAELAAQWNLGSGWRLDAQGVIQEAEIQPVTPRALDRREAGLPAIPQVSGRLAVARDVDLGPFHGAFQLSARYVGRSRLSFDPALDRRMGGYGVLDASASLSRGAWRVSVAAYNLLDEDADTFSFGNPFAVGAEDQRAPLAPRSLQARVERRF